MRRLPIAALTLGLLALGGCATVEPSTPAPAVVTVPASAGAVTPTELDLWHYDAEVVPLTLDGSTLTPPSDPTVLGWWGQEAGSDHGTTLLTGHTVHTGGGTFDDLEDLPVGTEGNVSGVAYEVVSVEVISKAELAERAEMLFAQDGEPRMVLVTCEGYDASTGHYDDNVVVTLIPV